MSYYYDPFYPSLEATRMEIQRSFLALQQKLRLQRQLDLDLGAQHRIRRDRTIELAAYQDELRLRQNLIKNDYLHERVYDREVADRVKYSQEEQQHNLRYLSKLQRLENERLQLSRERTNKSFDYKADYAGSRSPYGKIGREGYQNEEDDKLIRKYEDGTRARQLKQDIISRSKYNSAAKNVPQGRIPEDRTPYKNLNFGSQPFSNEKLVHINKSQGRGQYIPPNNQGNHEDDSVQPRFGVRDQGGYIPKSTGPIQNSNMYGSGVESNKKGSDFYNSAQKQGILKNSSGSGYKNYSDQYQNRRQVSGANVSGNFNSKTRNYQEGGYQPQSNTGKSLNNQDPGQGNKKSGTKNQGATFNALGGYIPKDERGSGKYEPYNTSHTPNKNKLSSRGRSRSQKNLNDENSKRSNLSPYRSFFDPSSDISPNKYKSKSKRQLNDKSKLSHIPAQQSAMQKIRNRLKLSQVVYEDSAYHNTKHELNHLFNTYDCECRLRRQLKMKINNHPAVLKKHAMVVQ